MTAVFGGGTLMPGGRNTLSVATWLVTAVIDVGYHDVIAPRIRCDQRADG